MTECSTCHQPIKEIIAKPAKPVTWWRLNRSDYRVEPMKVFKFTNENIWLQDKHFPMANPRKHKRNDYVHFPTRKVAIMAGIARAAIDRLWHSKELRKAISGENRLRRQLKTLEKKNA